MALESDHNQFTGPSTVSISSPSQRSPHAYIRAMDAVRRLAEGEDYAPGDKIPSERVLSEQLGLSRMTVRKAVDKLVQMGVLERRSTSGTHVALAKVRRPLDPAEVLGIPQIIKNSGGEPGSRLLFFESGTASEAVAERLAVPPGAPLIAIKVLLTSDSVPFCVEKTYIPASRVPGLAADDVAEGRSLYPVLKERYGIVPQRSRGVLSVAAINRDDAGLLGLPPETMGQIYRVIVYDAADQPVEYTISINHPQRTLFTTDRRLVVG